MRLIDADALKEFIDDCGICAICPQKAPRCSYDCDFPDFVTEKWNVAIDAQPTIDAVSEWIPCEERLPSEDGEYLVTWGEGFVSAFYYGKPTNYRHKEVKGKCFYEYNDEYGDAVCNDAIAWMPLPKPYERSDNGKDIQSADE